MSLPGRLRIVVTQGEGAQGSLAAALAARGAEVIPLPTISIEPPANLAPLDAALGALDHFDWVVFTSRHAVEAVCARPAWNAARAKALPSLRVAAVGRVTAESLRGRGVTADVVPAEAAGRALAEAIGSAGGIDVRGGGRPLAGVQILWPRSEIAMRELPEALARAGAKIVEAVAYRTVVPDGAEAVTEAVLTRLEEGSIDAIAFLSPSSAKNLPALLGRPDLAWIAARAAVASIGPSTSKALRELGAPPQVESSARTAEDVAKSLLSWLASHAAPGRRSPS
jgi:uroporphyrinogen-III synthase